MAKRLAAMDAPGYDLADPFKITLHPDRMADPCRVKKPARIGVSFMGDLFHDNVPDWFIRSVAGTLLDSPQHIFFLLTKRPYRMAEIAHDLQGFGPNVFCGVSVENNEQGGRLDSLIAAGIEKIWVSVEPMLGPVKFTNAQLRRIKFIALGGESGTNARPMHPDWVRVVRDQCQAATVPFMFKQWGKKAAGRLLDGREYMEMPK